MGFLLGGNIMIATQSTTLSLFPEFLGIFAVAVGSVSCKARGNQAKSLAGF